MRKSIILAVCVTLAAFLFSFSSNLRTVFAFDFSVSFNPSSDLIEPGNSSTTTITVTKVGGGAGQNVNLSVSCPSTFNCTLSRTSGKPTFTSTLSVDTSSSTPTGTYTIVATATNTTVVSGTSENLIRNSTYTLVVTNDINACPSGPISYPTDSWDRVWCNANFTTRLADSPDETNLEFNNNYGTGSVAGIRADDIGFRSGRMVNLTQTGIYNLSVGSDHGIKLWIDGNSVLDKVESNYTVESFNQTLTAGVHQFRIDYYHVANSSRVSFGMLTPAELPFAFSITLPASTTVLPNTSTNVTISVLLTQGTAQSIRLTVDCPSGVTCTLDPRDVTPANPAATSILTITTTNSTPLGTYDVNITGGSGNNATLSLAVSLTGPSGIPPFITDNLVVILLAVFGVIVLVVVYKTVIASRIKK